jgi:hypothetical protein
MGIFNLGRKPKGEKIVIGAFHVNMAPKTTAQTRNEARMKRLDHLLKTRPADDPSRPAFEKELKMRRLQAELNQLKGGK